MNIIKPSSFKIIKPIYLNTPTQVATPVGTNISFKGTLIGHLAYYRKTDEVVYLTYRGGGEHFMKKYSGLGIDYVLVDKFLSDYETTVKKIFDNFDMKVVFYYDGVREHRYYYITLSQLKRLAIEDGFASEKGGQIMTWGRQLFINLKDMDILGYAENDIDVLNWQKILSKGSVH